jgi:trk system potassium uptake protein TrkH
MRLRFLAHLRRWAVPIQRTARVAAQLLTGMNAAAARGANAAAAAAKAADRSARDGVQRILRSWRRMSPPGFFVASFALLIAVGTAGLLWLPGLYRGPDLGLLDALFTATSAVCVTGLIVVDTATYFSFWGQLWILVLIQLGGIGLITLTTAIIGALGGRLSLRAELTGLPGRPRGDQAAIWQLASAVTRFTLAAEATGTSVLFLLWRRRFPADEALWHALFQSVNAFCNAGFATFSDSLEGFQEDVPTVLVISLLIVLGGLGYLSVRECWDWWRWRPRTGRRPRLSVHTFAVLVSTMGLLLFGTVFYLTFEWDGVLAPLVTHERLANAWFMSVTARTAGFNTVPIAELGNDAGFLTMLLMFVGGSPGSTAGGLKTTTIAVLVALAWSRIRGRRHAQIRGRGVPDETLERAVSLTLMAFAVLTVAFFTLNTVTPAPASVGAGRAAFLPMSFEVVSAFATVGLSMGTTNVLGAGGKAVIILLMFIGRVGLFSFFSAILLRRGRAPACRLAREDLVVG